MDNRDLNPWDLHRINLNRQKVPMSDIKAPQPTARTAYPQYEEQMKYENISTPQETIKEKVSVNKNSHKKLYSLLAFVTILLAIFGGATFYFYKKSRVVVTPQQNQATADRELSDAVTNISKIAVLPITDNPTLFVVSDPEQLKSDAFFDNSKAGDQMLLYPRIGFAVLYRPSSNQIVNMIKFNPEINIDTTNTNSTSTATTTATTTKSR